MPQPIPSTASGRIVNEPPRPAVIAIEGSCFAGKTSLALALGHRLGVTTIPEYADLGPLPPFPARDLGDVRAALEYLLGVERRRTAAIRSSHSGVVVCDRSPLSCIAFQHAIGRLDVPADARLALELFATAADRGEIIEPDAYTYLHVDQTTALARQAVRGPVLACLMDPGVLAAMQAFYQRFLNSLPAGRRLVLDGAQPRSVLTERAARFAQGHRWTRGRWRGGAWRASLDWLAPQGGATRRRQP